MNFHKKAGDSLVRISEESTGLCANHFKKFMDPQSARQIAAVLDSPAVVGRLMREAFSAEDADVVIDQFLDLSTETSPEAKVHEAMSSLESFADFYPGQALLLMLALQPKASDLFLHDVSDRIDLWQDAVDSRFTISLHGVPAYSGKVLRDDDLDDGEKVPLAEEDSALGFFYTICGELQSSHQATLAITGFGLPWGMAVWGGLCVILEQLPHVLPALREGRLAELIFHEQGIGRVVHLDPTSGRARCERLGGEEHLGECLFAPQELIRSLTKLLVDFISYAWMAFPEEAGHPLFVEWQNACLPEAG